MTSPVQTAHWDVTRRSVFLSSEAKATANARISAHLQEVAAFLAKRMPGVNAYLSGSLAAGEPSFLTAQADVMRSDIDLVLVSDQPPTELTIVEAELQALFPSYHDTLYWLDPRYIAKLVSTSARDFVEGMAWPLHQAFHFEVPVPVALNPSHILPSLIYQVVGAYFSSGESKPGAIAGPQLWHQPASYFEMKLAADILKFCACMAGGPFAATLNDAFIHRLSNVMRSVVEPRDLETLIAAREIGVAMPDVDLGALAQKALSVGIGYEGGDVCELIEQYWQTVYRPRGLVFLFGPLVLTAWFRKSAGPRQARDLDALATRLLRLIAEDPLVSAPYRTELASVNASSAAGVGQHVARLRSPYIKEKLRLKDAGIPLWPSVLYQSSF